MTTFCKIITLSVLSCLFGLWPTMLHANPIYVITQSDGTIRFTNRQPPKGVSVEVFKARKGTFSFYKIKGGKVYWNEKAVKEFLRQYNDIITRASSVHNIPAHLIKAVIHAESSFNRLAISPKGAQGLMQLMPGTAQMLGVKNPFHVEENIEGGSKYLASLLRKYNGNLAYALAAYNAGEGAVERYKGIPPYSETRQYVKRVLALKDRYSSHVNG